MKFDAPTPIRDAFGKALVELGASNPNVVALTADLADAIKVQWFADKYPDRFFQMGIAESDMICVAAGLAMTGKIPFATTFATFAAGLANMAVKIAVAYNEANVKIATSHGGVCVGADGATHQGIDDIALMRAIPGMTVVVPCDANEAYKATLAIAEYVGPVYFRLGRIPTPIVDDAPFTIGKARIVREGKDVAIIACGSMVATAMEAAVALEVKKIKTTVVNMHTVKPLDVKTLVDVAGRCGAVVVAEEHSIIGGLGSAVAEALAANKPVPIEFVGIRDVFGESGEPAEILKKYGLCASDIEAAAEKVLKRK
ncbi:MAG: transketolase C-terminal domain-containing protein [Treponemataceae bacterium]